MKSIWQWLKNIFDRLFRRLKWRTPTPQLQVKILPTFTDGNYHKARRKYLRKTGYRIQIITMHNLPFNCSKVTIKTISTYTPPAIEWLGITVSTMNELNIKFHSLISTTAKIRFIHISPILSFIDLSNIVNLTTASKEVKYYNLLQPNDDESTSTQDKFPVQWIVCGGDAFHGMCIKNLEYAHNLRDQCIQASIPFHFKGWGNNNRKLEGREWNEFPTLT